MAAAGWEGAASAGTVSGREIARILEDSGGDAHYSSRYACAYLEHFQNGPSNVVWYLNGQAVRERVRLARLFGAGSICLSELSAVLPEVVSAMP